MKKTLVASLLLSSTAFAEAPTANLSANIPYPYYAVQKAEDGHQNKMMILNTGLGAFWKRVEAIRSAEKSIELEYFIYENDATSHALTVELVKAAKRGVKVRLLIDKSAAIFVLDEFYARALSGFGIEVRYYNDAPLIRVSSVNFRNHRKLITVDDKIAITGGRNIGDEYFDYRKDFNFLDRDVYIEGPIAKTLREQFDLYFESDITERPKFPKRPYQYITVGSGENSEKVENTVAIKEYEEKTRKAADFVVPSEESNDLIAKFEAAAVPFLSKKEMHLCPEVTISTDRPGGNFWTRLVDDYSEDYRYLRKTLFDKAFETDRKILISSPYMINSPKSMEIYEELLSRDIEIDIYTNSLASTDAVYVAANLYPSLKTWSEVGINTYLHAGEYIEEGTPLVADIKDAKWGTHSKTQLYFKKEESQNEFMIGTYNYDNRSNHYNTEMGVFCKGSKELFDELYENEMGRMKMGYMIGTDGKAYDKDGVERDIYGANRDDLLKMKLIAIPSRLLNLLL